MLSAGRREWKWLALLAGGFLGVFYLPVGTPRFDGAVLEALHLSRWYAREHVLLCLVPALFIAGAISVFVNQASVMKYLGAGASRIVAYGVASVSGTVLAVCSCTVLPLFAGIYRRGAGLGPATAFLYSGPAINVLAIVLTARVLGFELGVARAVAAVTLSIVIGLLMHLIFRRREAAKQAATAALSAPAAARPLHQETLYFGAMVAALVFANWSAPASSLDVWTAIHAVKWPITAAVGLALAVMLVAWFHLAWWKIGLAAGVTAALAAIVPGEPLVAFAAAMLGLSIVTGTDRGEAGDWFGATWEFTKQIVPLLFVGVLIAGALLGRPGHEGLIPSAWISSSVGGNSIASNLFASVVGAFMYFATLTEIPILQGLMDSGMGKGPALALLLAGPALSLPSMLVLRGVMGTAKTVVYVGLVIVMATVSGVIYGTWF